MTISRKKHSTQTKVKVVLEALKGEKTTTEITACYRQHNPADICRRIKT